MIDNKKVQNILKTWDGIKQEIIRLVKEHDINKLNKAVKKYIDTARKDLISLNKMVDIDYKTIKKKFQTEKKHIEKLVHKVVIAEIKTARLFLRKQRNELANLQKRINTMAAKKVAQRNSAKKTTAKKATAKKTTKKKVAKKKVTKKTATKKTVAKKTAKKKAVRKTTKKKTAK
jgi:hypothetical protein